VVHRELKVLRRGEKKHLNMAIIFIAIVEHVPHVLGVTVL
jgi:hypothetical protein